MVGGGALGVGGEAEVTERVAEGSVCAGRPPGRQVGVGEFAQALGEQPPVIGGGAVVTGLRQLPHEAVAHPDGVLEPALGHQHVGVGPSGSDVLQGRRVDGHLT